MFFFPSIFGVWLTHRQWELFSCHLILIRESLGSPVLYLKTPWKINQPFPAVRTLPHSTSTPPPPSLSPHIHKQMERENCTHDNKKSNVSKWIQNHIGKKFFFIACLTQPNYTNTGLSLAMNTSTYFWIFRDKKIRKSLLEILLSPFG